MAERLRTRATLRPGDKGTKGLVDIYGDRLVAVRYRYEPQSGRTFKTVEIVVDERLFSLSPTTVVFVRVAWAEHGLRARLRRAGVWWEPRKKLWRMQYAKAVALGVADRIVETGP